jgi:hypothetical protein
VGRPALPQGRERILLRDEHRYFAHPHLLALNSEAWLLVANCGPRRAVTMHPPQDPEYVNVLIRSHDQGQTWSPPAPVPGFGVTGTECAGLTALPNGSVLLTQWRFRWYPYTAPPNPAREPLAKGPAELLRDLVRSEEIAPEGPGASAEPERLMPWIRGGGALSACRSTDDGLTWPDCSPIDTHPFAGGYGMRGGIVLPDGELLLPLSDVPFYRRIFTVRSRDGGRSFSPATLVAEAPAREFEEPAPVLLSNGTILMLLRENVSHSLFAVRSADGGATWSEPTSTGIACYPAHVLRLGDGRIAAVAGRRRAPFGISIFLADQNGLRFDIEHPLVVRSRLPNKDLGYPTAIERSNGTLLIAYYYRDEGGVTAVHAIDVEV